jgi:glycosyltransferase involved in cell wall biosynthesis
MKPLVSILIPAYNAEEWIAQTIQSALDQTWPNKEVVIVDDGSTDRTLAIARGFASKSVSVHSRPNQGAQQARNTAYGLCQGDYIQWLDADDLLAPDKIARQLEALTRLDTSRTLLSAAWGGFLYRAHKAKFSRSALWCDLAPLEWLLRKMETGAHMQTATWLVSRELTELAGPWDTRLLVDQDGEYFCRVKLACDRIRFVPESKVYYRRTDGDRVSHVGVSRRKQESLLLSLQLLVKYTLSLDDSVRTRQACARYLQKRLIDIRPENADIAAELTKIGASLGATLRFPTSPARYSWLQKLIGWTAAERTRVIVRSSKVSVARSFDKAMFWFERKYSQQAEGRTLRHIDRRVV